MTGTKKIEKNPVTGLIHEYETGNELDVVPDYDTHIANLPSDDPRFRYKDTLHEWSEFAYGSKLFKATTVNDPELKKLVALFEWLVPTDSRAL